MNRFEFSDINIQEELAPIEGTEFIGWADVHAAYEYRKANPIPTIKTPFRKMDGRLEWSVGGYHLLGGYSGHGKSTIALQCLLYAAKDHKVAIASLEMTKENVAEAAYKMVAGTHLVADEYERKVAGWLQDRVMYYDRLDNIAPQEAIQAIIFAAKKGCKLILLDCLFMIEGICQDPEAEQRFTQTLSTVGKKFNVAIILVHHLRKPQGERGEKTIPSKSAFIGSSHMVNASLSCSLIWRDFEVIDNREQNIPTDEDDPDVIFKVDKNRLFKFHGQMNLFEHSSRLLCETKHRNVNRVVDL